MAGALGDALDASAAAERDRRFLVTAIAHDLRTPLFTLRGSLEAIERGIGDGDYLALAQRKADHLDRLVSDLFAFSRLEYARDAHARRARSTSRRWPAARPTRSSQRRRRLRGRAAAGRRSCRATPRRCSAC